MFRCCRDFPRCLPRFPRIRGDVPKTPRSSAGVCRFSPHTRGCSDDSQVCILAASVFPAYAGMFRSRESFSGALIGFPRIRGDVPQVAKPGDSPAVFSPHTRGCSPPVNVITAGPVVFPAYAGMFRAGLGHTRRRFGFPRIRGDVPLLSRFPAMSAPFSPHTRGCSQLGLSEIPETPVFPAYAGMFRAWGFDHATCRCFPRIRGDVPAGNIRSGNPWGFSPHTRGCSDAYGKSPGFLGVFPAYAGMFLFPRGA